MYLGIDCGTQSTKLLVWDPDTGVVGSASSPYGLIDGLPPGHKEQHPRTWLDALQDCLQQLEAADVDVHHVRGIGVSGQQHGAVFLDEADEPLRAAKLWCDTSTEAECAAIVAAAGGLASYQAEIGNALPPGFTAGKLRWLRDREPRRYRRLRSVLLPHDWLNFELTGRKTAEAGDASGTGYFRVRERTWSQRALAWIDPDRDLSAALPELIASHEPAGTLRPALARAWGMRPDVVVSSGSGDNMMAAIGAGCVGAGRVVMSLGTSGTVFACAPAPAVDPAGEVAAFCDGTGRWLPLGCTMHVTVATEMVRKQLFGPADSGNPEVTHEALEAAIRAVPPGCDGLILLPWLEGERLPNVPDATGAYLGVRPATATPSHFARAAMEGATLGLEQALEQLVSLLDTAPTELILMGGGARSAVWRQIVADITQLSVVCPSTEEGPALGAAIQAAWCHLGGDIADFTDAAIQYDPDSRATPKHDYTEVRAVYRAAATALRSGDFFPRHRQLIS